MAGPAGGGRPRSPTGAGGHRTRGAWSGARRARRATAPAASRWPARGASGDRAVLPAGSCGFQSLRPRRQSRSLRPSVRREERPPSRGAEWKWGPTSARLGVQGGTRGLVWCACAPDGGDENGPSLQAAPPAARSSVRGGGGGRPAHFGSGCPSKPRGHRDEGGRSLPPPGATCRALSRPGPGTERGLGVKTEGTQPAVIFPNNVSMLLRDLLH